MTTTKQADLYAEAATLRSRARNWFSREPASTGVVYAIVRHPFSATEVTPKVRVATGRGGTTWGTRPHQISEVAGFVALGRYDAPWDQYEAVVLGVYPTQELADAAVERWAERLVR